MKIKATIVHEYTVRPITDREYRQFRNTRGMKLAVVGADGMVVDFVADIEHARQVVRADNFGPVAIEVVES